MLRSPVRHPTEIGANLKNGGVPWRLLLPGSKILFVGDNTEGKNRTLAALTWALRGFVTEGQGKDTLADAGVLMELGTADGSTELLYSGVVLNNGDTFLRWTEGQVGSATEPEVRAPEWSRDLDIFPLHAFLDNTVGRSATTTRKYLTTLATLDAEALLGALPAAQEDLFFGFLVGGVALDAGFNDEDEDADAVKGENEAAKARRRLHRAGKAAFRADPVSGLRLAEDTSKVRRGSLASKIKGAKVILDDTTDKPTLVRDADVAAAADALKAADTQLETAQRTSYQVATAFQQATGLTLAAVSGQAERYTSEKLAAYAAQLKLAGRNALEDLRAKQAAVADGTQEVAAAQGAVAVAQRPGADAETILATLEVHTRREMKSCLVCGNKANPNAVEDFNARAEQLRTKLATGQKAAAAAAEALQAAQTRLRHANAAAATANTAVAAAKQRLQRCVELTARLPELTAQQAKVEEARKARTAAQEANQALTVKKARWSAYAEARDNLAAWEQEHAAVSALLTTVQRMQQSAVSDDRARFVGEVNRWMPGERVFDLQLSRGKRKDVRMGIARQTPHGTTALHTFISGFEAVGTYAAIGAALVCGRPQPLSFIIPQDLRERDVSPRHLTEIMRATAEVPACVYLFSTHPQHGRVPAGWHLVDLSTAFLPGEAPELPSAA